MRYLCYALPLFVLAGCPMPVYEIERPNGQTEQRADPVKFVELSVEYAKARAVIQAVVDDPTATDAAKIAAQRQLDAMDNAIAVAVETAVATLFRQALVYEAGVEVRHNRDGFMVRFKNGKNREALLDEWRAAQPLPKTVYKPPNPPITTHPAHR